MGQRYLIDSNVVIDYLSGKIPAKGMDFLNQLVNDTPNISVITKIEVLGYQTSIEASSLLTGFVNDSIVINLQDEIIDHTIEIRKEYKIKTPDAIIAATSRCGGFTLISRNEKDFKNIANLTVLNPHSL
jgi:predicted nucleic acid-binding protein